MKYLTNGDSTILNRKQKSKNKYEMKYLTDGESTILNSK